MPDLMDLPYFTECGSGPPLLLVHGLMVTGEMFEPVIGQLAARHRVIIPTCAAMGAAADSRRPTRPRNWPPTCRACSTTWASARPPCSATPRAAPSPNSWFWTTPSAATVSCSPAPTPSTWQQLASGSKVTSSRRSCASWAPGVGQARRLRGHQAAGQAACRLARRAHGGPGPQADGGCVAGDDGVRQQAPPGRDRLSDAGRGRLGGSGVPIHHARMLHDGIPGAELVIIDGADHALIWTHPDEFLRVTEEFLGA
jgi:pimeloyl-ACP methyl ester carboxylesterase